MGKHAAIRLPSPAKLATVLELRDGDLWWRPRKRGTVFLSARPVGAAPRPDGSRIVSLKFAGRMRTMRIERVKFALAHGQWPKGVVDQGVDRPRKAKSPGRKGGLKAEKARDQKALDALEGGALCLAHVADAVGGERSNVRRRLVRLAREGLVEPPPKCCPDRGWLLTRAGRDAALVDAPAPPPVAAKPWVHPVTNYRRHITDPGASPRFG
jgi:hypothetical protein